MTDVPTDEVAIPLDGRSGSIEAFFTRPARPGGLVVFAHGSGSSRHSSRNQYVASRLNEAGMATLMLDLLTPEEDALDRESREYRFDIPLLAERVGRALEWAKEDAEAGALPAGLFGASTGAAAALIAAAKRPADVGAVVSRGGRPDLAGDALPRVGAPTMLIVGGRDTHVVSLNRDAASRLAAEKRLEIIPNAGHLFEERGCLDAAATAAKDWFTEHLAA